ncbi:hypothetical protein [Halarchaeum sp. CBA1220]|uniref:hypothetical protein n=1 Tax=Halarchaeum sp. CBA1220 TaxID=1853682 RepID=UPI0021059D81|nr:hypothetical protein [Halarchaeum sp. CBA1220]
MLIYALVEASTRDEALAAGKSTFDRLIGVTPETGAVLDYDGFRQGIRNRECLKQVLGGNQMCWVMTADVHY